MIHTSFQVVSWIARPVAAVAGGIVDALGFGKYLWKDGRFSFQVDYDIAILNYASKRVWPDHTKQLQSGCTRVTLFLATARSVSFASII